MQTAASVLDTEGVTGSIPVSPTSITAGQRHQSRSAPVPLSRLWPSAGSEKAARASRTRSSSPCLTWVSVLRVVPGACRLLTGRSPGDSGAGEGASASRVWCQPAADPRAPSPSAPVPSGAPYDPEVDQEPGRDLSGRPIPGSPGEPTDHQSRSAPPRYRVFLHRFLPVGAAFVFVGVIALLTGDGVSIWLVSGLAWIALGLLVQVVINARGRRGPPQGPA